MSNINGKIIAKAHNLRDSSQIITKHAEIIAIEKANKKFKNWRLINCTLYTTLKPCRMCQEVINSSKLEKVVYSSESNNDLINYYLNCFYETRKEAVNMINEKYLKDSKIKIELELNNELLKMLREKDMINLEVGDNLEQIYDNNQESSQE